MEQIRKIIDVGGSRGMILPLPICEHLGVEVGDEVIVKDDTGKRGRFVAVWKKEKE